MKFKRIMALLLVSVMMFSSIVCAKTLEEMQQEQEEQQAEIKANEELQKRLLQEIARIQKVIYELGSQIDEKSKVIADYEVQLEKKKKEIAQTKKELDTAREKEEKYKAQVLERIKITYEYGDTSFMEVLLESNDLGEFFNRLEYVSKIFKYDEVMLDKLEKIHENIELKQTKLEIDEVVLDHLIAETNLQKEELELLSEHRKDEKAKVDNDRQLAIAEGIQMAKEAKEIERAIEKKKLETRFAFKDGDTFSWPTPGYFYITSSFGYRIHPVTNVKSFHNGTDIGAPYGADVIAAASGVVVLAAPSGSYGNLVVINHGNGYMTYYAHNTTLLVKEGQEVLRKDVIAKVGSTGRSTGPHLHFGVKKNGQFVEPMNYFKQ